jgi:hypothetical protein
MTAREVNCANCGAPRRVENPGTLMFVCEYCGSAVYWDEGQVRASGQKAALTEGFTRLYRGASGSLRGKRFATEGRVRYSFGRGFWDEWYLRFDDGSTAWLTEDNHELCVEARVAEVPPPNGGYARVSIRGIDFVVEERGEAECIGAEGELPFVVRLGEKYRYVDGSSPDGKHAVGVEYDEDPANVFVGDWLVHEDIRLDDEGEDWA